MEFETIFYCISHLILLFSHWNTNQKSNDSSITFSLGEAGMTVSEDNLSWYWMRTAAGAVLLVFPAPLVIEEYYGAAVWSYSTPASL